MRLLRPHRRAPRRTPSGRRGAVARLLAAVAVGVAVVVGAFSVPGPSSGAPEVTEALPKAACGAGSRPEPGTAGRAPAADFASGRAQRGYTCNARQVSRVGRTGGLKVHRYRDRNGRTCAYYDLALAFPQGVLKDGVRGLGTAVLDMTNPRRPVRTATLTSPAMLSPHESLHLHEGRGLLVAVMGTLTTAPGMLDVYDVARDCRRPRLLSSTPAGFLGHESGMSPDGRTFYASALVGLTITAVDLTDPRLPRPLTTIHGVLSHGVRTSPDGNLLYVADLGVPNAERLTEGGLKVYDVSQIQARRPFPRARLLTDFSWPDVAIPQVPEPMRIRGRDYLLMVDEFSELAMDPTFSYRPQNAAAIARIIDVQDPRRPQQVSTLRLQVQLTRNRAGDQQGDPGATNPIGGYSAHYCAIPRYRNPKLAACAYIGSGLRIFDIRDPRRPREVAYFNKPTSTGGYAMAKPAFDRPRRTVWFTDVDGGFFAVELAKRIWPRGL